MKTFLYAGKIVLFSLILLFFLACGYKPSSKFSRDIVGQKISTSVLISAEDPENTVLVKDAVDSAIIEVFHASLSDRENADTHLLLSISNPSYSPIQYDSNGYVIAYRMSITLSITRSHDGISKHYAAKGTYDFSVQANAVVTDQERFEAIKFSAAKAISSFLAQISAEGARSK
ncbi:hypothetical protein KJ877_08465 [bacterium]|nr:hypothetical protein [bacterium]MBU1990729.1 hypothetical protein [bacterium]